MECKGVMHLQLTLPLTCTLPSSPALPLKGPPRRCWCHCPPPRVRRRLLAAVWRPQGGSRRVQQQVPGRWKAEGPAAASGRTCREGEGGGAGGVMTGAGAGAWRVEGKSTRCDFGEDMVRRGWGGEGWGEPQVQVPGRWTAEGPAAALGRAVCQAGAKGAESGRGRCGRG